MMTRNPYSFEFEENNNTVDTSSVNSTTTENRNVRKHKSLMNMKSYFHSSIPRRSNSIDRSKTRYSTSLFNEDEKEKLQSSSSHSTSLSNTFNHKNTEKNSVTIPQLEKDKKRVVLKEKKDESTYSSESLKILLASSSKNVKSLDDEKANYLLNKYTKNLLKKPKETLMPSTESKYFSSSSIPQPSTINSEESMRKPYHFTAKSASHAINKENINNSVSASSSLNSHHLTSRLKYPISFNKMRTPLSELKSTSTKNIEEQNSIGSQQKLKLPQSIFTKKDIEKSPSILSQSEPKKSAVAVTLPDSNSLTTSKIKASIPNSPKTPQTEKSTSSLITDINSNYLLSLSPLSSSGNDIIHSIKDLSKEQNTETEDRNNIDDKTILNTFTVAFDNISSLSTKIDLLTEIIDKNEEKQQHQYNTDMNQINFELFEIKQKVSQSMKKLQQEFDPILNTLKETAKVQGKNEEQKMNEKDKLSLKSETFDKNRDQMEQDLDRIKSQLLHLTNENQILKKRLDIITRKIPYLFIFHMITFGFLLLFFIHEIPSDKKHEIYQFGIQSKKFILHYFFLILHWITGIWNQMIAYLNHQYYY